MVRRLFGPVLSLRTSLVGLAVALVLVLVLATLLALLLVTPLLMVVALSLDSPALLLMSVALALVPRVRAGIALSRRRSRTLAELPASGLFPFVVTARGVLLVSVAPGLV